MGGEGSASAIPAHLYRYSDRSTHAAQELHNWVRAVLAPALHTYVQGGTTRQQGVNIDIGAVLARVSAVENELPGQLAAAQRTDQEVRKVGLAFQLAGGQGGSARASTRAVRTTDAVIAGLTARYDAGAAAAGRLPDPPPLIDGEATTPGAEFNPVFALLEDNAGNPEFCRGLLQAGGADGLRKLLLSLTSGQFQSNLRSGALATDIVAKILRNGLADPNIGAQLAPFLPTLVPQLLNSGSPRLDGPAVWRTLLPSLTVIVGSLPDPGAAARLTRSVAAAVPPGFGAEDLRSILPAMTAFLSAGVAHSVAPQRPGTEIVDWADGLGKMTAWEVMPFLASVKAADLSANEQSALVKGLMQGAYLNIAFMPLAVAEPEGAAAALAFSAAMGAFQSWVGSVDPTDTLGLGNVLKDHHANKDVLALSSLTTKAAQLAMISTLIGQGRVHDVATGKTLALGGDPAVAAQQIATVAGQPKDYEISGVEGGGSRRVDEAMNDLRVNAQDLSSPDSELVKLLGADS